MHYVPLECSNSWCTCFNQDEIIEQIVLRGTSSGVLTGWLRVSTFQARGSMLAMLELTCSEYSKQIDVLFFTV